MGWFDNPDSAEARRKADADRRRRIEEQDQRVRSERAKAEKKRALERRALDAERRAEDEKAINDLAEKYIEKRPEVLPETEKKISLNRGSGFRTFAHGSPNLPTHGGTQIPGPVGFNPNAPREGQESETSKAGRANKGDIPGLPKLPRP